MASFNATFFTVQNGAISGGTMPAPQGNGAVGTATLSTSATAQTAQRGGTDWAAPADGFVRVHSDGAVRIGVGETAATGASPVGHYLATNAEADLSIAAGQTLSVIDA